MSNITLADASAQYAATAGLNFVEQWWQSLFIGRDEWVVITVVSLVMHEVVYFGRFLPFWLCDYIPYLRQYKIQDKDNTPGQLWKCTKSLLFSHTFIQLPLIALFHPTGKWFGMKITEVPFPSWQAMALQIFLFMVFEDTFHYWMHRALHYGPFYRYIHKQHHEFSAPFGLTAEYAHPLEILILGMGTIGGPLLWVMATGDMHIFTVLTWIVVRLLQTVDSHSGYDFPWSLRHWLPFWSGAEHHDYHHMAFVNNYSTAFRWWDYLCGTDSKYRAWKKEQEKIKASKKVQ
ncbi:C-4 sterol methyl oxidase [Dimargaris cristalligena]|uniref:Fatty acid hydroxylase superfamily-domain-containing protein n=1 Tax=Dimargaris cristalligena TaxID=215637 RepID=A0A4P9ZZP1_9FUNG|nr:C-4 sterol methyl oxidase [Dimargaris cristalligena]RKP38300.1 fatty acid hydroxylase superfamily-domain-containing protein [Dimargaris cristalligena]|eukprot:RKP38300.1 fatty acid hydroxylase superfamily-domain-containing protein [Dimargaris cristalligena]